MATLLELAQIEIDSRASPTDGNADIAAAAQLRAKIRMALTIHARTFLNDGTITVGETTYPSSGEERNNAVGWAQRVMASPDPATDAAMRIALAGAEALTPAQIRGIADAAIKAALTALIPALAKGMHPGR